MEENCEIEVKLNLPSHVSTTTQPLPKNDERDRWGSKLEFLLAVAGQIIGLGNVWRFPYLCYKNGGGVFLVPYFLFLFTCGIPLFLLETSVGQYTSQGSITCWQKICPIFGGLGYGSQVVVFYSSVYYVIILAWAFFYLFSSFSPELPWSTCGNSWNTEFCVEYCKRNLSRNCSFSDNSSTSPLEEFWERQVLNITGNMNEIGNIRWELALCLLLAWIICFFCVWKGVKSTGKVVYFTATFPYLMLAVLLVRGLTLPGAVDGIKFYLYPDPSRLADPRVWSDAGTQIFYSYALCIGCLEALGSYNKYNNNCYKDCLYLCLLNSGTSFVAGFAIFSVLGFMAEQQGVDISVVADSGPGLAFIAYPQAVAMMPVPQVWAACFFIMIILLGLDSQFVGLEAMVTAISDMYPSFFQVRLRRKLLLLLICVIAFSIGLSMVTEGGLYVFQVFDTYAVSGMTLLAIAIFQSIAIGWVYGADRLYDNIEDMIGYRPLPLIKYCWPYVTPVVCSATLIFSLVKYTPLKFNNTQEYPWWGYALGWFLTLSSTLMVPLYVLYIVNATPGSFRQRLRQVCTPATSAPDSRAQMDPLKYPFEPIKVPSQSIPSKEVIWDSVKDSSQP